MLSSTTATIAPPTRAPSAAGREAGQRQQTDDQALPVTPGAEGECEGDDRPVQSRHRSIRSQSVRLYVCYGTFGSGGHPCAKAHDALREAGYEPEVERVYGGYFSNPVFPGRRKVKELSGSYNVPTLVLDDGTVVDESQRIVDWAASNPAARG